MNYGKCAYCQTEEYLEGDLYELYQRTTGSLVDVCVDCISEYDLWLTDDPTNTFVYENPEEPEPEEEEEEEPDEECELCYHIGDDVRVFTYSGEVLCDDCRDDNYFDCLGCGTTGDINNWDHYQCECDDCYSEGGYRCVYCYQEHRDYLSEGEGGEIRPYSYKPEALFHNDSGFIDFTPKSDTVYYGVELETQAQGWDEVYSGDDIPALVSTLVHGSGEGDAYLKEDGSISGVEIVTHPATLEHHMNIFPWEDIIDACEEDGLVTDDRAGLHIHASKAGFGSTRSEQAQVETNLLAVLEVHWDKWVELARGENRTYAPRNCDWNKHSDPLTEEKLQYGKAKGHCSALNLENDATAELRINRSTLDIDEIKACIQGFDTMISLAKTLDLNAILRLTWSDVTKQAWKLGHLELVEFFTTWDTSKLTPQY